ncbi:protein-L-isoaspartate O-methyltransferase family protein [Methylocystis bryophila]|nr:methyltransferase domain-containing protein [Methylocystis bryophila]
MLMNATITEPLGAGTAAARRVMVERQLRPYDVTDLEVLNRFLAVPREIFLPRHLAPVAYSDLSIEAANGDRWEPAPLVLARFLQIADIRPHHKVLHIAGGEGYAAALLAGLAGEVVALESDEKLAAKARENLAKVSASVRVVTGPLAKGAPAEAPFDVILVQGAVEYGLEGLISQLKPDGRLLAFKRHDPRAGMKAVRIDLSEGRVAGERPVFDAAAPVLEEFAKPAAFVL